MKHIDETRQVVWPRGRKSLMVTSLAKHLESLEGKVSGELWDDLLRGDELFPILEEGLAKRIPGVSFVNHEVFGCTDGDEAHQVLASLPEKPRRHKMAAVISGMAC